MQRKPGLLLFIIGVLLPILYSFLVLYSVVFSNDLYDETIPFAINGVLSTTLYYLDMPYGAENIPIIIFSLCVGFIGLSNFIIWKILRDKNDIRGTKKRKLLRFLCGLTISLALLCMCLQLPGLPMLVFGIVFALLMAGADNPQAGNGDFTSLIFMLMTSIILLTPLFTLIVSSILSHHLKERLNLTKTKDVYFWLGVLLVVLAFIVMFIIIGIIMPLSKDRAYMAQQAQLNPKYNFIYIITSDHDPFSCILQITNPSQAQKGDCSAVSFFHLYNFKTHQAMPITFEEVKNLRDANKLLITQTQLPYSPDGYLVDSNCQIHASKLFSGSDLSNYGICLRKDGKWERINVNPFVGYINRFTFIGWDLSHENN